MQFAIVRPAGQVSQPSAGFSTPTKVVMTAFVLGFFAFAYSSSKQAEREATAGLEKARRDEVRRRRTRANPAKRPSKWQDKETETRVAASMFQRNSDVAGWKHLGSHSGWTKSGSALTVDVYSRPDSYRPGRDSVRWVAKVSGVPIGSGSGVYNPNESPPYLETEEAAVLAQGQRQGVYSEVLRGLSKVMRVELVSDNSLSRGAIGAWKKSGAKVEYWQGDRRYVLKPRKAA